MTEPDLLNILHDLSDEQFKDFKWALKYEKAGNTSSIKKSKLSNAERRDVVDLMVQKYKLAGAVKVIKSVLKKISRNDLVEKLSTIISGGKDQERVLQRKFPVVIEDEFSREMCAHYPKVQILRGVNLIILEGAVMVVQLAETKLEDPIKKIEHLKNLHLQRADEVQKNISDKNRQAEGAGGKLPDHRTTQDSVMKPGFNRHFAVPDAPDLRTDDWKNWSGQECYW
ncbi:uncharacterized protein LOC122972247 [Scomber scombrus]|uniref:Uncharacterized protein LOC122972247 n=1 Tax=Scomber scombrus TaxID=13677 RepID=A0AAV1QLL0_SCOSC